MINIFDRRSKKGQLTLTFNWIYVLIAGAIILLFFIGIIVKQKSVSEEQLSYDITRTLESIIVAATVSEQTKNFIDTSSLKDYSFKFTCEIEDPGGFKDIFSGYGIEGSSATVETPIEPIFAPEEIKTTEIVAWSLPYEMPFKVMDVLLITSSNTKYYVLGEGSFKTELLNSTSGLNFEFVDSFDDIKAGNNFHVRVVDVSDVGGASDITHNGNIPPNLESLSDSQVSAVSFTSGNNVKFYHKEGNAFVGDDGDGPGVPIISLFPVERDAAKYAAIFAGSEELYKCNMMKIFKRLEILAEVYEFRNLELRDYYEAGPGVYNTQCTASDYSSTELILLVSNAGSCTSSLTGYASCSNMMSSAGLIKNMNENLHDKSCVMLY